MRAISATADIAATPQQLWAVPAGLDAHPPQPNPFTRRPPGRQPGGDPHPAAGPRAGPDQDRPAAGAGR